MGPETIAFEMELAEYLGVPHAVTVNSCTSALFLALVAHGVGPGDEVICPSLTWCATANAALYLGATPVFCDVDAETLCVTPETVAARVTSRTKAVMVVHFGGLAADVAGIAAALPAGVAIVEDAAHALGARFPDGRTVGSSGNLTCFSFYANKNLSTGEGGAIALYDDAVASRLRSLRQSGLSSDAWKRYSHPTNALVPALTELGYKLNFTDLNAVIGRVQLRRQGDFGKVRQAVARHYLERLSAPGLGVGFQCGLAGDHHARHLLVALLPGHGPGTRRNELVLELRRRNIGASIHYAPLHTMPLYGGAARNGALPVTERITRSNVTLPISGSITRTDADYVCDHLIDVLTHGWKES